MSFSLYVGSLVYGGFGMGAQEAPVVIPLNSGESSYCEYVDRKFFVNNGGCDGCGGSNPHEWDVQEIKINGGVDGGLVIRWDSSEDAYKVENGDGSEIGWCTWTEPGDSESCNDGTDNYNMANYMDCDVDVDVEW